MISRQTQFVKKIPKDKILWDHFLTESPFKQRPVFKFEDESFDTGASSPDTSHKNT